MRNWCLQQTLETPQGRAVFEFLRQEMPRSTLQSALQIYNPAQPAMASEATLQKLLKIYNFNAAQLFSLDGICNLMANKVRWSIQHELVTLGYVAGQRLEEIFICLSLQLLKPGCYHWKPTLPGLASMCRSPNWRTSGWQLQTISPSNFHYNLLKPLQTTISALSFSS